MRVQKTYAFPVDFEQEEDGRWGVDIPAVPVCAAWGFTREEALENLQDLTQGYFEMLVEYGDPLPQGIEACEIPPGTEPALKAEIITISI